MKESIILLIIMALTILLVAIILFISYYTAYKLAKKKLENIEDVIRCPHKRSKFYLKEIEEDLLRVIDIMDYCVISIWRFERNIKSKRISLLNEARRTTGWMQVRR